MSTQSRRWGICLALGASLSCFATGALAQEPEAKLALPRFDPAPAGDQFFSVPGPITPGHLKVRAMIFSDYAHNPFVLVDSNGDEKARVVEHQMLLHFNLTTVAWDRLALNLDFPVVFQSGEGLVANGSSLPEPSTGAGDLRIGLRGRLFGQPDDLIQLALGGYLFVPFGHDYASDSSVRGWVHGVAGGKVSRFIWSAAFGPELRSSEDAYTTPQGHRFTWTAGAGVLLGADEQIQLGPELLGSLTFDDVTKRTSNIELFLGGKYRLPADIVVGLGGGMGMTTGVGTPDARGVLSVAWTPRDKDSDGDGILDKDDACPTVAGISSDDPAKHGCPADTDGDGIFDADDACPKVAGIATQDPKTHGCPAVAPADADGDGILDADDACPQVAGKADPDPKKNGCPDTDGDGFLDKDDACPKVAGIASSDPTKHGCPVSDKDGDGVLDGVDACIDVPGIKTADPKTNGCPSDRDGDGFIDTKDACPDKPGPANADPKKNGCPIVAILDNDLKGVEFDTNLASIRPATSTSSLRQSRRHIHLALGAGGGGGGPAVVRMRMPR